MRNQSILRHRPVAIPLAGGVYAAGLSIACSSILGIALAVGLLGVAAFSRFRLSGEVR
jgi:hypothetical protein